MTGLKMNNLDSYRQIYNLETLNLDSISKNTITFILLDDNNNYYYLQDKTFITYSVEIPLNILNLINNIEKIYKVKIHNYFPICLNENNSIIFACKIKETSDYITLYEDKKNKLIKICDKKSKYFSDDYNDEILTVEKYKKRYEFYNKHIKKRILTEKRRRKKEFLALIKTLIGKGKTIIDVSCGDNDDIFKMSDNFDLVVGNDINLYQLKHNEIKYDNVIFTNDNILDLSFSENIFDVSYCKNTLHHMNNEEELETLLDNLHKISNKMILVEILDPKVTGGLPRFLNTFLYNIYLKDSGKNYLDFDRFKKIIDRKYREKCDIDYLSFENILGKYMIAVIEKR